METPWKPWKLVLSRNKFTQRGLASVCVAGTLMLTAAEVSACY